MMHCLSESKRGRMFLELMLKHLEASQHTPRTIIYGERGPMEPFILEKHRWWEGEEMPAS